MKLSIIKDLGLHGKKAFFRLKKPLKRYNSGFTLVELLISMAVFMFLGIMLVSVFRSGMTLWHVAEGRKTVFRRARTVLAVFRDDLRSLYRTDYMRSGEPVDVRMVSDYITDGTTADAYQRVRFIRNIPREMQDSILRDSGTYSIGDPYQELAVYDQFDDNAELQRALNADPPTWLGAAGGLMEVGYLQKGESLYRGIIAPLGHITANGASSQKVSLFNGAEFFSLGGSIMTDHARVLARNVLHWEMRFWGPDSESWNIDDPITADNASYTWDSTRVDQKNQAGFDASTDEDHPSRYDEPAAVFGDPRDDLYPSKIKVILVVDSGRRTRALTRYAGASGGNIQCTTTRGFVKNAPERQYIKIGREWIKYSSVSGDTFIVEERGARHTEEVTHTAGDEVYQGHTFSMVIDIPGVN